MKVRIPSDAAVTATVGIGPRAEGGFGIIAQLGIRLQDLDPAQARQVVDLAHQICPYSNATRNNVDVSVNVLWPKPKEIAGTRDRGSAMQCEENSMSSEITRELLQPPPSKVCPAGKRACSSSRTWRVRTAVAIRILCRALGTCGRHHGFGAR